MAPKDQHENAAKAPELRPRRHRVPSVHEHATSSRHFLLAVETGLSAHAVAAALGHESVTTTLQSYAKAGAGASARQEKVLTVLAGGKKGEERAA